MNIKLLKLKAWLHWTLVQTIPLWMVLSAPTIFLPVVGWLGEGGVKAYALVLQICGAWVATSAIRQNLDIFKAGGVLAAIGAWWDRRPRQRSYTISLEAGAYENSGGSATFSVSVGRNPNESVEVQLEKLWKSLEGLRNEAESDRKEVDSKVEVLRKSLTEAKAAHEQSTRELADTVKKAVASSPLWSYYGAWLAAVGTVLSTYTHELVCWVQP